MTDLEPLIGQIDRQFQLLLRTRAVFPYMDKGAVGFREFDTAPFYQQILGPIRLTFASELSEEDVRQHNGIGHWINQNFLVRLCALLDEHGILRPQIDDQLEGHDEVDLLRRLRNIFVHTAGELDPCNPEHMKLADRIRTNYGLPNMAPSEAPVFPLPIDTVIGPIVQACKRYIKARATSAPDIHAGEASNPLPPARRFERYSALRRSGNRALYLLVAVALYLGSGWIGNIAQIVNREVLTGTDYPEAVLPILQVGAEWPVAYAAGFVIIAILSLAYTGSVQASLRTERETIITGRQSSALAAGNTQPGVLDLLEENAYTSPRPLRLAIAAITPAVLAGALLESGYFLFRIAIHGDLKIGATGTVLLYVAGIMQGLAWWGYVKYLWAKYRMGSD